MFNNNFTEKDIKWLKDNSRKYKLKELVSIFNTDKNTVKELLNSLNLKYQIRKSRPIDIDFMENEARHYTVQKIADRFNLTIDSTRTMFKNKNLPYRKKNIEYIPSNKRVKRNINKVYLNIGDKLRVINNTHLDIREEDYNCVVVKEYLDYYLVRKENGIYTTIFKISDEVNISKRS